MSRYDISTQCVDIVLISQLLRFMVIISFAEEDEEPTVLSKKEIVLKSKAPVDERCALADTCHVFCEEDDVWDVALNQTAIDTNNNKYYIIQLLENDSQKQYHVFQRWGRVGLFGQQSTVPCGADLASAKKQFCSK